MRIGPYPVAEGAVLAPMAGITNPPFRQLCREMGAVLTCSELVSCHAILALCSRPNMRTQRQGLRTLGLLSRYSGEQPLVVQLYGRDPKQMAEAARIVVQEGAEIIDLNFGCPARKVVRDGAGAGVALMRDPRLLAEVTRAVVHAIEVPITAKIRTGWSRVERNAVLVAQMLEAEGTAAICVHARSREQVHSGPIDLETLAEVCQAVSIPVVGNGGVRSRQDADEMLRLTGCKRVAIGQAAKGNPWIFREILGGQEGSSLAERISTCRRHLQLYAEFAGERRAAQEMRKHACWYIKGFPGAALFRSRLGVAVDVESFSRLLDELPGPDT